MKYLTILLTLFIFSCEVNEPTNNVIPEQDACDTTVITKVDTFTQYEIREVVKTEYVKEVYCPIDLANQVTQLSTDLSKIKDSLYNYIQMQELLLEYVPEHIQEAFKNKD